MATDPEINNFDDLSNYVVAQIEQPSILIAQSMGGIFAIAATLQKTDLVKGLVLIATSGERLASALSTRIFGIP